MIFGDLNEPVHKENTQGGTPMSSKINNKKRKGSFE
jgi:hypothetical protein